MENWQQAARDYSMALTLLPGEPADIHDLAVVSLYLGDVERYKDVCQAISDFDELGSASLRVARACCVASETPVDLAELYHKVESWWSASGYEYDETLQLVRGMVAYRRGRSEDSLQFLPKKGAEVVLAMSLLFQAMAHHNLGDGDHAIRLLGIAREKIQQEVPTCDGPRLAPDYYNPERPIAWCTLQILLREAEGVINETALGPDAVLSTSRS
jgi:hypothetical protein